MPQIHVRVDGSVADGKLTLKRSNLWTSAIKALEGKEVSVTIGPRRKPRSDNQNRWYWACVVAIPADHFGYLPEEMHNAFKWMFLRREEPGKPATIRSSASLTTKEFSDYCEACRKFCAEQGLFIPDPFTWQDPADLTGD